MNTISMPGFTAEAALYTPVGSYRSSFLFQTKTGLDVTPQMGPDWPRIRVCVGANCFEDPIPIHVPFGGGPGGGSNNRIAIACRVQCYSRFRNNTVLLKPCLKECG